MLFNSSRVQFIVGEGISKQQEFEAARDIIFTIGRQRVIEE